MLGYVFFPVWVVPYFWSAWAIRKRMWKSSLSLQENTEATEPELWHSSSKILLWVLGTKYLLLIHVHHYLTKKHLVSCVSDALLPWDRMGVEGCCSWFQSFGVLSREIQLKNCKAQHDKLGNSGIQIRLHHEFALKCIYDIMLAPN